VAARAVGTDVFEVAVSDPVIDHGMAGTIVEHQQKDSLAPVFRRCVERGSGMHCRIPLCYVVIRWIGSGRDRRQFRLHRPLRIEVVAEIKRVSAQAEIKSVKVTGAGEQRQKWFEEADLGHAVEKASRGRKPPKAVDEETAMRGHVRRNERNFAVGAVWE